MSTSGLAGVPSLAKGEGRPAATVSSALVASAERGSAKSSADNPSTPTPRKRSATLRDNRVLCTVPFPSVVGEGRRRGSRPATSSARSALCVGVNHNVPKSYNQRMASFRSRHALVAVRSTTKADPTKPWPPTPRSGPTGSWPEWGPHSPTILGHGLGRQGRADHWRQQRDR